MGVEFPAETEEFRAELRAWLDEHLTGEWRAAAHGLARTTEELDVLRGWNHLLADAGYAAISWPEQYGGRDAGVLDQVVWAEEMHRAAAPGPLNVLGIPNVAPAIMTYGTEEQKSSLLPRMLRGDDLWCQGFSEPEAGSDLASLRAVAVRDREDFVVTGQKVWTTLGHFADWCELLVRTDPDAPTHMGITCLLVDMSLAGIEVRPLVTATGEHEFNELFFDEVRVPVDAALGPVNGGWRVAMTTLANERGGVARLHLALRAKIARLLDHARHEWNGDDAGDPRLRQRLVAAYVAGELMRLLAERAVARAVAGQLPGPESSLMKLVWSRAEQLAAEVGCEVLGAAALLAEPGRDIVASRSHTIAGGTTEVNKNVIAERILGLPRT
jgi:alkylation response protein AidB-like acyl-CoA dehydrogenase